MGSKANIQVRIQMMYEFSNAYDYMNEFGFQYLLINAQDGKISDPYTSGKVSILLQKL